jgi:hypothetical protein
MSDSENQRALTMEKTTTKTVVIASLAILLLSASFLAGGLYFDEDSEEHLYVNWDDVPLRSPPPIRAHGESDEPGERTRIDVDKELPRTPPGLLAGRVFISDGVRKVPASGSVLYWIRAPKIGKPEDGRLADMERIKADGMGSFAGTVPDAKAVYLYITHPYGVAQRHAVHLPAVDREYVLEAAARLNVHLLGSQSRASFRVVVSPS